MSTPFSKMKINPMFDPHNESEVFYTRPEVADALYAHFYTNDWVFYLKNGHAGYPEIYPYNHYAKVEVPANLRNREMFKGIAELVLLNMFGLEHHDQNTKISEYMFRNVILDTIEHFKNSGAFVPIEPSTFGF